MINGVSDEDVIYAVKVFDAIGKELTYKSICKTTNEDFAEYKKLLSSFKSINEDKTKEYSDQEKGKALEDLVNKLLEMSGDLFRIKRNIHSSTNEIDQIVTLSTKGKALLSNGLINNRLAEFLGECKNHNKAIDVTYTGKFCSLLLTTDTCLGILFSYNGLTGRGKWADAVGLVKKFYLHKEKEQERFCIIDFNINEFELVAKGDNILDIIDKKLESLKYDTSCSDYISEHPAEKYI